MLARQSVCERERCLHLFGSAHRRYFSAEHTLDVLCAIAPDRRSRIGDVQARYLILRPAMCKSLCAGFVGLVKYDVQTMRPRSDWIVYPCIVCACYKRPCGAACAQVMYLRRLQKIGGLGCARPHEYAWLMDVCGCAAGASDERVAEHSPIAFVVVVVVGADAHTGALHGPEMWGGIVPFDCWN